ncbi:MAG: cupin-like domain-containing protein, partial [Saprospiraceae bacterium]
MELEQIERRTGLSPEEFQATYLKEKRPVIFTDLAKDWPATKKWTFDWLKKNHGELIVPLIGPDYHLPGKGYMSPKMKIPFGEYLDMIQRGPTELRLFLWNIFKAAPTLVDDVKIPKIMKGFVKEYPFMFFGGQGAVTNLHYDIDCSNVFITHFVTTKRIVLFAPDQAPYLYSHPFTVQAEVNVDHPDYKKFPAFKYAKGFETELKHGETLYIPSLYWHYIYYTEGGYSISLRAMDGIGSKLHGLMNLARHFVIDKGLNKVMGATWKRWKEKKSQEN